MVPPEVTILVGMRKKTNQKFKWKFSWWGFHGTFFKKNNFGVVLKLYNATCICMVAYTLKPVCLLMKQDPKTLLLGGFVFGT